MKVTIEEVESMDNFVATVDGIPVRDIENIAHRPAGIAIRSELSPARADEAGRPCAGNPARHSPC